MKKRGAEAFSVNRAIRDFIKERNLVAAKVADRAGISRAVFWNILNCKRVIYADELIPIVIASGIPLERVIRAVEQGEASA